MKVRYIIILQVLFFTNLCTGQVFINQDGYSPNLVKYFYTTSLTDSFYIINKDNGEIAYKGALEVRSLYDPATGLTLSSGEFTNLKTPGNYYIKTLSGDTSYSFLISNDVYKDVYYKSLKGFYYQRCGTALFNTHAGSYHHLSCHGLDGFFHSSTGMTNFLPSSGGWHDAGDFGKYIVNAGITVGTLLMAYELFPAMFNADDLLIPESNNKIPDILDEIRYELNWMFKMQSANGGVYFKLTKQQFESIVMPNADNDTRYVYQLSTTATGDFAAVMSRAYRVYNLYDTSFANKCLNAAKAAWVYLSNNPNIVPIGGFKNPTGTATGEYGDSDDRDERLWASSELYMSTGDIAYHDYYVTHYKESSLMSSMSWPNVRGLANLTYLTITRNQPNQTIKDELKNALVNYCNVQITRSNSDGFRLNLIPGEYTWGSNSDVLNKAILQIICYDITKNTNYLNNVVHQFNYIMGCNAHDISFVTGTGKKSVMHPHHRQSQADNIVNPVPGLIAGGPNQYRNDPVLASKFTSSTPPALCFIDDFESYGSNEIAINWNAPLVFVAGYLNNVNKPSSLKNEEILTPDEILINQNYPNPFNSSTKVDFYLTVEEPVSIKIYDVKGEIVFSKCLTGLQKGDNHFFWTGTDNNGGVLNSGVYFLRIEGKVNSDTKKLVLMK